MTMLRIKSWLSRRDVSIFILVLTILSRMTTQLYFFRLGDDRSFQLVGAKNLLAGHGITFNQVFTSDLSHQAFQPIVGWPPGYSVFVAMLTFITGDITVAAILFDLISVFILVFFSRKILKLLGCSNLVTNCFTFITGFFLFDFSQGAAPDINAVAFYILALFMMLSYIRTDKTSMGFLLVLALINFIPPFLRYMFIPVALIIPMYLIISSLFSKDKRIMKGGVIVLSITVLLLAGLLVFQTNYTGAATYVNPAVKGWFPGNLREFYPVVVSAFIHMTFVYSVSTNFGITYGSFSTAVWILSTVAAFALLFLAARLFIRKKFRNVNLRDHFIYLGTITSVVILGLLFALSLRYAALPRTIKNWTYVQESRYMAFIMIFLQMLAFIMIFNNWSNIRNKLWKYVGVFLIILLSLQTLHGLYFMSNIITSDKGYFHPDRNYIARKELIKELIKKYNPDSTRELVFASNEKTFVNMASLYGAKALYNFDPGKTIVSAKPFTIVLMLGSNYSGPLDTLLKADVLMPIKTIGNLNFYEYRSDRQ